MDKISNSNIGNLLNNSHKFHNNRAEIEKGPNRPSLRGDHISLSSNNRIAAQLVFRSVQQQFVSKPVDSETEVSKVTEKDGTIGFDVESVVKTIFDFVSNGINNAKENGASDEELEVMFAQAREGINLGLNQALEELEELSMLTEELTDGVEQSRNLLTTEIDELYKQLFSSEELIENSIQTVSSIEATRASSETNELTLTTRDGDEVSIYFGRESSAALSFEQSQSEEQRTSSFSVGISQSQSFSFSVKGDISSDERQAIGDLLKQVANVQTSFFDNDIEGALAKVDELDVNFEQLSSVSLSLSKSSAATQNYNDVANFANDKPLSSFKDEIGRLSSFMESLKDLKDQVGKELDINNGQFISIMNAMLTKAFKPSESSANVFSRLADTVFGSDK